jgi:hypothetical protein
MDGVDSGEYFLSASAFVSEGEAGGQGPVNGGARRCKTSESATDGRLGLARGCGVAENMSQVARMTPAENTCLYFESLEE